ncbi:hypothetical protein A7982_12914 [Minicystis rosea]|nr:hypothetical protein A7982_12914 [Minicystis rosea]
MITTPNRRPLVAAGTVMGMGMGGFFDGILFHQILQTHNMLSNWIPTKSLVDIQINMVWDGVFHAFCWIMVGIGLGMLWRIMARPDAPRSGRTYAGSLLLGWGAFNLVEGLVDHEILQIHHVYQNGPHLLWDMVFLASGVCLIVAGAATIRGDRRPDARRA